MFLQGKPSRNWASDSWASEPKLVYLRTTPGCKPALHPPAASNSLAMSHRRPGSCLIPWKPGMIPTLRRERSRGARRALGFPEKRSDPSTSYWAPCLEDKTFGLLVSDQKNLVSDQKKTTLCPYRPCQDPDILATSLRLPMRPHKCNVRISSPSFTMQKLLKVQRQDPKSVVYEAKVAESVQNMPDITTIKTHRPLHCCVMWQKLLLDATASRLQRGPS